MVPPADGCGLPWAGRRVDDRRAVGAVAEWADRSAETRCPGRARGNDLRREGWRLQDGQGAGAPGPGTSREAGRERGTIRDASPGRSPIDGTGVAHSVGCENGRGAPRRRN